MARAKIKLSFYVKGAFKTMEVIAMGKDSAELIADAKFTVKLTYKDAKKIEVDNYTLLEH